MTDSEPIPICRHCRRAIWRHDYAGTTTWRHFHGYMLCEPSAVVLDVDSLAVPSEESSLPG